VAVSTWKPARWQGPPVGDRTPPPLRPIRTLAAAQLIRQRRSCLALDGIISITAETFYALLDPLLPRFRVPPWDMLLSFGQRCRAGTTVTRSLAERNHTQEDRKATVVAL
jgi:hypothetical protein